MRNTKKRKKMMMIINRDYNFENKDPQRYEKYRVR